jgi:hypothetical protein
MIRWTPSNITRLRNMCAETPRPTPAMMAGALGTTSNAISTRVSRLGLGQWDRITLEQGDRIAEMRESGSTFGQIAMVIKKSAATICAYCVENGIDGPIKPRLRPDFHLTRPIVMRRGLPVRAFTPQEDASLRAMSMDGVSYADMGRTLNRNPKSVRKRLVALARRDRMAEEAA